MKRENYIEDIEKMRRFLPVYQDRFKKAEKFILAGISDLVPEAKNAIEIALDDTNKTYGALRRSLVLATNAKTEEEMEIVCELKTIYRELVRSDSNLLQFYFTLSSGGEIAKEVNKDIETV